MSTMEILRRFTEVIMAQNRTLAEVCFGNLPNPKLANLLHVVSLCRLSFWRLE